MLEINPIKLLNEIAGIGQDNKLEKKSQTNNKYNTLESNKV